MTAAKPPKAAPKGLKTRGRSLWRSICSAYAMNPAEELILHELCRVADVLDHLNAELAAVDPVVRGSEGQPRPHPLYATVLEWEKAAVLLSRRLALPDDHLVAKRSATAVHANNVRWAMRGKGA